MKIAVIGSGIAGNAAAWALNPHHDVTLYERRLRPGGHSATADISYDGAPISVDTGFIVYNTLNYPNLTALFGHLDIATEQINMSFSVSIKGHNEWRGRFPSGLFAQRRNLFSPSFLWMLREIFRFNQESVQDLARDSLDNLSLGDYLSAKKYSKRFRQEYLVPLGAAIWSTPVCEMLNFPAKNFIQFCKNHRLLQQDRAKWRTVSGGSRAYVEKMLAPLGGRLRLGCEATAVKRGANHVTVEDSHGGAHIFDHVIMAGHTDQTLRALQDASDQERDILSSIRYRPNTVYLHRDLALMPKRKTVWAAWNYLSWPKHEPLAEPDITVSYWMNLLQNIDRQTPLFITLNPPKPPRDELTFGVFEYDHPQFDQRAVVAQNKLEQIQGVNRTWFCGAWTGYGFHEDGLISGLDVALKLGAVIPWQESHSHMRLEAAE